MDSFPDHMLSRDAFLGGKLTLAQPLKGYRAGVDPVFLAASVPAKPGQRVLDLGCGAGAAALCVGARVPGVALFGVERQPSYADLARENAARNGLALDVVTADLGDMPLKLRDLQFHHVIANPPYFDRDRGTAAPDQRREEAMGGDVDLALWARVASARARPKGKVTFVHRAGSVMDVARAFDAAGLGSLRILPLAPRRGRDARLVLVQAIKGGRADLRLHAPMILHAGDQHISDKEGYSPDANAILRRGEALVWPG